MTPGGTITRKDIVSDDALQFGGLLVAEYEKVIKVQKELVDITLQYAKANTSIRKVENQQQFIDEKQKIILLDQQALSVIKQTQALEISTQKIKQETTKTLEAERKAKQAVIDAETKEQKVKQGSIKLTIEERIQNEINNKLLKQEALERLGLVTVYGKLSKARIDAKIALKELILTEGVSTAEIKKAQKEFDILDNKIRKADAAVGDFTKNVGNYPLKNITSGIQNLIGAFGVTGGIAAFAGILKGAYETTKQFEQGVADLSSITGATGKNLEFLKNSAIDLGKSTKGGAIAVVEAYKLIASAKPELLDNVQALNQVTEATITLAKAAGIEIPEAATALTDAMNQFGVDASQAGVFVDALANGAKYGAAEIPQVTEALLKFGAVARSSNISIKESTALVELLAENGLKGADAGTALRNVLLKISAPDALPKKAREEMERLGISFEFLKDKTIPVADKLEKLKPLLKDNASIVKVFGLENATAAINVLAHTDRLKDLTAKMGEVGTAEEQAAIRTNTINAGYDFLISQIQSFTIKTGEASNVIKTITSAFKFLGNNIEEIITVIGYSIAGWGAYKASLLLANVQQKLMALNLTTTTTVQTVNTVATEAGAAAQIVNAEATTVATTAWERFNLALKANFLGLLIAGLVAAIYYMDKFKVSIKQQNEEVSNSTNKFLENREVVAKNEITLNKLADRYDVLTGKSKLNRSEQDELNKIIKILSKTVPDAVTEFDKYGDALAINTKKVRGYTESQKELIGLQTQKALKDNIDLLGKLKKEQQEFNDLTNKKVNENVSLTYVEDLGYLERRNGKILKYNEYLMTTRELTDEERIAWKKSVVANEQNIASTENRIKQLRGLSQAKKEAIAGADVTTTAPPIEDGSPNENKDAEKRNKAALDKQKKFIEEYLKNIKKRNDDEFSLNQFRLEREVYYNELVLNDDKKSVEERISAYVNIENSRKKIADNILEHELQNNVLSDESLKTKSKKEIDEIIRKSNIEIKQILKTGELKKNASKEEILIYEKYILEIKKLDDKAQKDKQKIIDSEVAQIEKGIEREKLAQETAMNEMIEKENDNFKKQLEAANGKYEAIEKAEKEHQKNLAKIKEDADKAGLKSIIDEIGAYLEADSKKVDSSKLSTDERKKYEGKLQKAKAEYNAFDVEDTLKSEKEKAELVKKKKEIIKKLEQDLASAVKDIANSIFDTRISNIDAEISKSDEYYAGEIEKAGNDQRKKDILQKEAERKRQELEKKKRVEQHKQAVFNKAMQAATITISTIGAVMTALRDVPKVDYGISAGIIAAGYGVVGAAQLAALLATPLPKYKDGRIGGKAEMAIVGDGGRNEIIQRKSGLVEMTPRTDTLVKLLEGDSVHSSVEDYQRYLKASMLSNISIQNTKINDYQAGIIFDIHNQKLIDEMKLTRKAIEKNKSNVVVNTPKLDINHQLWKMRNTNWN